MAFLGSFLLGQTVTFTVTWTPAPDQPTITGSSFTLTHVESGEAIGPSAASSVGVNAWAVVAKPTKRGNWAVACTTTPEGGVTSDEIYVS